MAVASPEQYLADLNPTQREAVLTTEGPLLVIAGAGSGKTRVLTYRVAHLINAVGAKPNEILAITFTNKAAGEMKERLQRLLGRTGQGLWILTFHAACGRILRREAQRLGYRSNFTIYDQADQVRLVKQCLEELERDPKRFTPRGIHNQISQAKNRLISPDEYANQVQSFYDQTVADVYQLYQRRMFASNAVDFDDLLMLTVDVLERFPDVREKWQKAFRYILVDEYQDTNHAQYRLLQLLAEKHQNLMAVGDPDQSIYAFRGADINNILDFERDFPGTRTIALEQNYRSTNSILNAANTSSPTTASASRRSSGPSSATVSPSACWKWRTSTPRRGSSRRASPGSSRKAFPATKSRSSTGRTRSRVFSRTSSFARASATRSSVARASTSAPRSRTRSPISR